MAKADLHVHSKHSEHPSEWFLQRIGAHESYTEPEFIYETAKSQGMDFVTITDHNRIDGALLLRERHPADVFTGVETTAYFPEDGCKVHVLIYGLEAEHFDEIQRLRTDIYQLRDFLQEQELAHAVAHATYPVNGKLSLSVLEKLILLFDTFEGINGGRNAPNNEGWMNYLRRLTPERIEDLRRRHRIEPVGGEPWVKGLTAGSDDHGGLFIGKTFASAEAATPVEFLRRLRSKAGTPHGRHNDYQSLAFTIYKVAYDFSRTKQDSPARTLFGQLSEFIFNRRELSLGDRFKLNFLRTGSGDRMDTLIVQLVDELRAHADTPPDRRFALVYDKVAAISDEFLLTMFRSLERDLAKGDLARLIKNISASLPGIFLSVPFFSTAKYLADSRGLLQQLEQSADPAARPAGRRTLWFTDTLTDLNGVSVTLREIAHRAREQNLDVTIVSSLLPGKQTDDLPANIINLRHLHSFHLPYYESYVLMIPSLLHALKDLHDARPDQIYISTPGPVGLLGLLMSRLFGVPAIGVYHTDFRAQALDVTGQESVAGLLEGYLKWFYGAMDEIKVPTREYMSILESRGYDRLRMSVFKRGIDGSRFSPVPGARERVRRAWRLPDGPMLLYAGRISKDKNLQFLLDVFGRMARTRPTASLIIAGDGPHLAELRRTMPPAGTVAFTGALRRDALIELYSAADVFVFPSLTDTFGMVVLEAQACGLPAIVSDIGGPREIIVNGKTGFTAAANDPVDWDEKLNYLLNLASEHPAVFAGMRRAARRNVLIRFGWDAVLRDITGATHIQPSVTLPELAEPAETEQSVTIPATAAA